MDTVEREGGQSRDSKREKQLENEDYKYYKTNKKKREVNMKRSHPVKERGETHWGLFVHFLFLYVSLTLLIKSVPKGSRYNTFIMCWIIPTVANSPF